MGMWSKAAACGLALVASLPGIGRAAADGPSLADRVVVLPLGDEAFENGRSWKRVRDVLDQAARDGAVGVVFELSASGSHPLEVFRDVVTRVAASGPRTVAFVNPSATGAASALALASDAIYLAPTGVMGASLPAAPEAGEEGADDGAAAARRNFEAQIAVLSAQMKAVARVKGRDAETVAALVDPDLELRAAGPDGTVLKPAGRLLALDAQAALDGLGGRLGIANGIAGSIEEIVAAEGWSAEGVLRAEPGSLAFPADEPAGPESEGAAATGVADRADRAARAGDPASTSDGEDAGFGRTREESFAGHVVVIDVGDDDLLSKARFDFMKRMLAKADADGARAVVFDMNTPGGIAWYTSQLMMQELQQVRIPTITYVNPAAVSAGALVAVATDAIYMAPAATIGAAAVVTGTGQELDETMRDKVNATIISVARNVAELKGHNPDVVEAFIDRDKEVVIDGVVVSPKGRLLSLNTTTATEEFGGRPLLAKGVAASLDEILAQEGLADAPVTRAEPLGMEAVAEWIQRISVVLILVGIVGAYLEMQSPGFGVPGLVALLAFALFFFGNNVAGKLAGYELFVIFGLGVALLVVELLILPGTVIPGVIGFVLMMGAVLFAMVDRLDLEAIRKGAELSPGWAEALSGPLRTLMLSLFGAVVLIGLAMAYLPRLPFLNRLVLTASVGGGRGQGAPTSTGAAAATGRTETEIGLDGVVPRAVATGDVGEALTDLRPSGRVRLGEAILDAATDGEFVRAGARVSVASVEGGHVTVREVPGPGREDPLPAGA